MDKICEWHICDKKVNSGRKFCSRSCGSKFAVDRRRKELKKLAVEYKGGKCYICGYNLFVSALDFHHLSCFKKEFGLSTNGVTKSWDKVKQEIEKCILLCCRCHREVHEGCHREELNKYSNELCQGNHTFEWGIDKTNRQQLNKHHNLLLRQKKCLICNNVFDPGKTNKTNCSVECNNKSKAPDLGRYRKVKDRPSKEELKTMINEMSWVGIGRKYGVSDNAVRKWARKYELI